MKEIAAFGAASETFSQKNINCSIAESLKRFETVIEEAKRHKLKVSINRALSLYTVVLCCSRCLSSPVSTSMHFFEFTCLLDPRLRQLCRWVPLRGRN